MATLTVQKTNVYSATLTYTAASSTGDRFRMPAGGAYLIFKNDGTASVYAGVDGKKACDFGTIHSTQIAVGAGQTKVYGPVRHRFHADSEGYGTISYTGTPTGLSVAIVAR